MRKLVFVADDYDHLADLIADRIRRETKWETIALRNGEEVLELAQSRRPDVCILDVDMPLIGGTEAAEQLRKFFPEKAPVLIGVTETVSAEHITSFHVFDHILLKPMDMSTLIKLIEGT